MAEGCRGKEAEKWSGKGKAVFSSFQHFLLGESWCGELYFRLCVLYPVQKLTHFFFFSIP